MKSLSFTLGFLLSFPLTIWAAPRASSGGSAEIKYPRLTEVSGKVLVTDKDGKTKPAQKNMRLVEKITIETSAGATATLQLDAARKLIIWSSTRLQIPAISWETGEAPALQLRAGTVRWQQSAKGSYEITLSSDLFELAPPAGDYIFHFDPKTAIAGVKVIDGKITFSAMHAEESADVGPGQKCDFHGVKENGEVIYDVLLQGKKIPRGHLGPVAEFSMAEKKSYSAGALKHQAEISRQKQKAAALAEQNAKDPLQICAKPAARLNQCAWICTNNAPHEKTLCRVERPGVGCVRRRCNANGEWAEDTEIPQEKAVVQCSATPKVRECDY